MKLQKALEYYADGGKVTRDDFSEGVYVFMKDDVFMVHNSDGIDRPCFLV